MIAHRACNRPYRAVSQATVRGVPQARDRDRGSALVYSLVYRTPYPDSISLPALATVAGAGASGVLHNAALSFNWGHVLA